jgi:hypothetical protein
MTKATSGRLPEVAMKNFVALVGNAKVMLNGANTRGNVVVFAKLL